ncbi:MAG TPA: DEAD/DEAH box helicase [Thermoplasmata archaeon]|nr:DEAD/DEAH box helicase [Thermoplasmata archaeon]
MTIRAGAGFTGLDPRVLEELGRRGITEPTEIQRLAFKALATGDDALLVSPTGSGKTEAAVLPLLSERLAHPRPPISVLYVTPLRALNRDLEQRLVSLAKSVGLSAAVRHGDTSAGQRVRLSKHPPDLLLTTPETLQLLLVGPRLRLGLREVRTVVVDELHELAPSDRGAQLMVTLERLDALVGRRVRRVGLSATIGNPEAVARYLSPAPRTAGVYRATRPRRVRITATVPRDDRPPLDPALVADLRADPIQLAALRNLEETIRAHRTTLVFVNTRPTAEGLAARLHRLAPDLPVSVHHGSLSREVREEAEKSFREGALRGLVATSSLELGIDVGFVDCVVQFGSPHQAGRLLQRVGRSGHRLDREVVGEVLALDDEDLEEAAVLARRAVEGEIEPTTWRRANRLAAAQQLVAALRAEPSVDLAEVARTIRGAEPIQELSDGEWDALVTYLEALGSLRREGSRIRAGRGTLTRFYATLSLIPDQRTYRLRDIGTRRPIGTLDERFVLTQILGQPEQIFLLHGRTWKVVEFRDDELLVEPVREIGQEPRWVGEDLPVPFDVAQEIGRMRRERDVRAYPLDGDARARLETRIAAGHAAGPVPDDRTVTVVPQGRLVIFGACFGTRTNDTLAVAIAGALTERLGAHVEITAVEPTWIVLNLPAALDAPALAQALRLPPEELEGRLTRLVPGGLEYRWVFLNVARKFGALPTSVDPRDSRRLEPLLDASQTNPLGEEALDKTLHDRFDVAHARLVLTQIRDGAIALVPSPRSDWTDLPLARLRWREVPDTPPPTLLRAVEERLRAEPLVLVCLRCGFERTTTPSRYAAEGGSRCGLCHGALSAVLSPRREDEIRALVAYAKRKWKGRKAPRTLPASLPPLVRAGYTSAELVANFGERALLALAARGVGPETARRLLSRPYRETRELVAEIVRAERSYARTRAFWD